MHPMWREPDRSSDAKWSWYRTGTEMSASRNPTSTATTKGTDWPGRSRGTLWAILRVVLGVLQMFGASLSVVLLLKTGVSPVSLTAVVLTCLCTTVSVLVFGSRSPRHGR